MQRAAGNGAIAIPRSRRLRHMIRTGVGASPESRHQIGFTLIEVMVSLVIASLGLTAIAVSLQQHTQTAMKLRDRTLAMYIASNEIATLRLAGAYPDVGRSTDEVTFADREWLVETNIQESGIEGLRRADVTISAANQPDRPVRTVAGFVSSTPGAQPGIAPSFGDLTRPQGVTQ